MTAASPRAAAILALGGLIAASAGLPALAGAMDDHRIRGGSIAAQLCSECHMVGLTAQPGVFAGPAFLRIADAPSTTGPALNVFLQSHHERMPSLRLDRDEMDAVIDYILGLRTTETNTP